MKRILLCDSGEYEKVSELCVKYNLGVNVDVSTPEYYLEYKPNKLNEKIEGYGNVEILSIHGCFEDLKIDSSDILIRKITAKRFEYAYEISCKMKCKNIVLPNGYVPGRTQSLAVELWFWKHFLKNKDKETIFYIKNELDETPMYINDLINAVNDENLKMCLDIGHANVFSKVKIMDWIKKVNKNIGFVYLYNNNGKINKHNGLSNGKINMIEICEALEQYCQNAIWQIETVEYEDSIKWLKEYKYIK